MNLFLAIKAFFKALKDPEGANDFLTGQSKKTDVSDLSHLRLLTMLQNSSRLIDFLKEDISAFDDAQVGAAVRKIHSDCSQCLEDVVTIRPLFEEPEGTKIQVPKGYDPLKIKLVGNVKGESPFNGVLVHKGWKVHKRSLPKNVSGHVGDVIWPAEVEIR